jgi:hypothetical protein
MKKILLILFFIVTACGYEPLYKTKNEIDKINISDIEISGDITLSKKILSKLPVKIFKDKSLNKLILDSNKNIIETSKNSQGQIASYRTIVIVQLSLLDNKDNLIKRRTISKDFLYNTIENKFKLKEYQIEVENNLINKIVEDINIYLKFR